MAGCITAIFLIVGGWGRGLHVHTDLNVVFMYIIQLPAEGI